MVTALRGGATGSFFTAHDARWQYASELEGGTLISNSGNPASFTRRSLAATGTTSVSGVFAIDAQWRAVAFRWAWCAEGGGSGDVVFQFRYGLIYPLLGNSATNVTLTTISLSAVNPPATAGTSVYSLPSETAEIETPEDAFFATKPIMTYSVDRLGDDASDTFADAVSVYITTITRVD